jgi:hypothetical protein
MRRTLLQDLPEVLNHILAIFLSRELMIPKSFHENPSRRKKRVAFLVKLQLRGKTVPITVEFDRQLRFKTIEIQIVRILLVLSAKLVTGETTVSKQFPELLLRPCGLLP